MRSFSVRRALRGFAAVVSIGACSSRAGAQTKPKAVDGFALERFYPSAPGGGYFVMDALDMRGRLGGALSLTVGNAMLPLQLTSGTQRVAVVSNEAFADFGLAASFDRFRVYLNLHMPLVTKGRSGTAFGYSFVGPSVDLGSNPDTLSDARLGFDTRIYGDSDGPFRLGLGTQLFLPNGVDRKTGRRPDYNTDDTFRAMLRILCAGDLGLFSYAGHVGVHVRPLSEPGVPGSPQGSELLFGVSGGTKFPVGKTGGTAVILGPELFGATALQPLLTPNTTAFEGLLTSRIEGMAKSGPQLRVKLGAGVGLNPHFGAPQARVLFSIELFGRGDAGN